MWGWGIEIYEIEDEKLQREKFEGLPMDYFIPFVELFAMVFCMGATVLGNWFTAAVFDSFGGYIAAWQSYTVVLACAAIPAFALRRAHPPT